MPKLLKTTKFGTGRGTHYHIVYLGDQGQPIDTGIANQHVHKMIYYAPQPAQTDPQTGQETVPAQQGGWVVEPAEDGHSHSLEEYVTTPKKSDETDQKICSDIRDLYKAAKGHWKDSLTKAKESEEFFAGEQWEEDISRKLKGEGRAALTIDAIEPKINELSGYERQQRTEWKYTPVEGSDQKVADLLGIITKQILTQCFYGREKSKVFEDVCITGVGYFNLFVDRSEKLEGVIRVEKYPYDEILLGPHEKEDLDDCEYVLKHKMFSKAKLTQLYPDKADQLQKNFRYYEEEPKSTHTRYKPDQYSQSSNFLPVSEGDDIFVDVARKEYRVVECQRRIYSKSYVIVNSADDYYYNATGWSDKDIEGAKTIQGIEAISKYLAQIRITRVCGNVVLTDENPADLASNDFFIVPVYARKRRNKFWGKVEKCKDPQREINKRHSQAVDVGNKMASYVWLIDSGTFPDPESKQNFIRNSSTPGAIINVADLSRPPQKIEGVKFPSELAQLMQLGDQRIAEIMNISVSQPGANTSGDAILTQQKVRLTGNEYLFDNLSFAQQKLGRLLLPLIQRYYTPQRIFRIVQAANQKVPVELAGETFDNFSEEDVTQMLGTADLGEFDVAVTESDASPTTRMANFILMKDLAAAGMQIPPEVLFEFADIPENSKKKILDTIAAQTQAQGQATSDANQTEVEKTLIAKGVITPEMSQKYGIPQNPPPQPQQPQAPPPGQQPQQPPQAPPPQQPTQ